MAPYTRVHGQLEEKFSGETPKIAPDTPLVKGAGGEYNYATNHKDHRVVGYFTDRGWNFVGTGNYASVFIHPSHPNKVLKIFKWDPAYLRFWSIAKNSDNPHFPEVSRMGLVNVPIRVQSLDEIKDISIRMFVVLVEQLLPMSHFRGDDTMYSWAMEIMVQAGNCAEFGNPISPEVQKVYPHLNDAAMMIRQAKLKNTKTLNKYSIDIHDENVMFRDPFFPVITDPMS